MLSKEEKKAKNTAFWAGFKQYMRAIHNAEGKRINWLKYPTEIQELYLRLHADDEGCALFLDVQSKHVEIREIIWEQLGELKAVMDAEMDFPSTWHSTYYDLTGMEISRIAWVNDSLNYYKEEDTEAIYEFLHDRIRSFDRFYQEFKDILIALVS